MLLYHSTTETAALIHSSTPTNGFPCTPVIALPDAPSLLCPQTGTAKSFCSVLLSHLLSLQNKLIHVGVFTSRGRAEKSHPCLGTSPLLPHCTDPFPPLSVFTAFQVTFQLTQSHISAMTCIYKIAIQDKVWLGFICLFSPFYRS